MTTELTSAQVFRLDGISRLEDLDEAIRIIQWDAARRGPVLCWPDGKRRVLSPRGRLLVA